MPRAARKRSSTGIYHIVLRGVNRQTIFADAEDNGKFLRILSDCKKICGFALYGYCLMGNHAHILLKEGEEDLGGIFRRVGTRYVHWFNWKHNRCGHLFQDRFSSEPVEDDGYFVTALRYIHQNPTKAGMCESIGVYPWSSYNQYMTKTGIVDTKLAFEIIGEKDFAACMTEMQNDKCLEDRSGRLRDDELAEQIESKFNVKATAVQEEPRANMEKILREMLKTDGVSTRQLSRVTGVSANIIWRLDS